MNRKYADIFHNICLRFTKHITYLLININERGTGSFHLEPAYLLLTANLSYIYRESYKYLPRIFQYINCESSNIDRVSS